MKKLLVLLFSILISFNSSADWIGFTQDTSNNSYYIDTNTIKKNNGYIYYWYLKDLVSTNEFGDTSIAVYSQVDCSINRYKPLSYVFYKKHMGIGESETDDSYNEWIYPTPGNVGFSILDYLCDNFK